MSDTNNDFASASLTVGQLNAVVKKLGGHEAVLKFLRGELIVSAIKAVAKIFTLVLSGAKKASELVREGNYGWVNDWITDERFPITPHEPTSRMIEFVEFDHDMSSEQVLAEFTRRGLERPTTEDALQFGIEHPEEQRKRPVVFLHGPVRDRDGDPDVLVLREDDVQRSLSLCWFDNVWGRDCVFAGVRK